MRPLAWLVVTGAMLVTAGWLIVSGWRQPRPALAMVLGRMHDSGRRDPRSRAASGARVRSITDRWARHAERRWAPTLRLIGRPPEVHAGVLAAAGLVGLVAPVAIALLLRLTGIAPVSMIVPTGLALTTAVIAPAIAHADARARAADVRIDLRYQLSAYLDMVVMLLAGNTGHEGALRQAAEAGDGLLFRQLRRRMREVGATGHSLVDALLLVAEDYGLVELEQVAATSSLSAAQGAPVSRTLAAKCSTLRGSIASEQEARARIRTDKVTPPLVGMALLFMALIIYPALNLN